MSSQKGQPSFAVIGAGFSGMCMAIKLKEAGFSEVTLFEKADNVGGTWRENTYPGVACDVPSHLYSFSFAPKPDWSRVYSPGAEIQDYCEEIAEHFELHNQTCFGFELVKSEYGKGKWTLTFSNGEKRVVNFLISCVGGLHIPKFPKIRGSETFSGEAFHSAQWDHGCDLRGKSVAVIGTAASALQFIPEIVNRVKRLEVYQRTPNWVMPRESGRYKKGTKSLFRTIPALAKLLRLFLYISHEMRVPLFRGNRFFAKRAQKRAQDHMVKQVPDGPLRKKLTPDYPVGCKRILASDTYYPALQMDHVSLHTEGIDEIVAEGIIDKTGERQEVDVIIYATGFQPFDVTNHIEITGREGRTLKDFMGDGIRAHRTVAISGFPNYFTMLGPNSGLGHNSILLIIEAQAKYIVQAIKHTMNKTATTVEPKADYMDAFNADLQEQLKETVWAGNCNSWYQDETGHIFTLWPKGTVSFRRALAKFDPREYTFSG